MDSTCIVCNCLLTSGKVSTDIFGENLILQSQKKFPDVLGDILEKNIKKDSTLGNVVCNKCFKACSEYDSIQVRLQVIKQNLLNQFKNTLTKRSLDYESCDVDVAMIKTERKEARTIVLPASKLQPVPADFVFDFNKLAAMSKANTFHNRNKTLTSSQTPTISLKVTVGSSVLTQSIKASTAIIQKETVTSPAKESDVIVTSLLPTSTMTSSPIMSFNVNSLPKEFLTRATSAGVKHEEFEDENNDEQPMEIDEDCSLSVVPVTNEEGKLVFDVGPLKKLKSTQDATYKNVEYLDVGLLLSDGETDEQTDKDNYILGKVQIVNDDDDEDGQSILLESGARLLRVGGELLYGAPYVLDEDQDGHESNEDTQLELQVSGDEETTNALLAAAQEQGGAIIEVDTGGMIRVKSVQKDKQTDELTTQMVKAEGDGKFSCLLCETSAKDDENQTVFVGDADKMMQHLKSAHDARLYICRTCGHIVRWRSLYSKHMLEHAPAIGSHTCGVCGKRLASPLALAEHAREHAAPREHACAVCHKTFANKYTYRAHLRIHQDRPRSFKCVQCGKAFFSQQNLSQHEKTHLGVKHFVCSICGKAFSTQHNLEVHGVIHSGKRPFACSHCRKAFARRAELRDHERTHTGERPFACDVCAATFAQRSNLHSHKRATHLADARHACDACPKKFKRRRLLEYHTKAVHTGERPLRCDLCPATFVYPEHHKKHLRIHNGLKPYECEVCGKTFNSRDNRNTHRFVHSEKKPYECLTCGAGYMRKQLLYAHMNSFGHVAESIVVNQPRVINTNDNTISTRVVDVHEMEAKPSTNLADNMYETKIELQDLTSIVLQDGKSLNYQVQDSEDHLLLQELNASIATSADILTTTSDKLDETQNVITDENGTMMRLIQVQLPDGKDGWVAVAVTGDVTA